MNKSDKIYVAGHRGMVGSAIVRRLMHEGYNNIVVRTSKEIDLRDTVAVHKFFADELPDYVFMAAAKVGGIVANNTYRADFLYDNLMIQNNVIHAAHEYKVKGLQFMGSSCIYPKLAPQPLKEEYLLTGLLEPTNEPYAIAKIAGIKLCDAFKHQHNDNFHSVMPTNLYGPNDNYDLEKSHVLPALIRKFYLASLWQHGHIDTILEDLCMVEQDFDMARDYLNQKGISKNKGQVDVALWGSGSPKREFLHVNDLARACVFLMNSDYDGSFVNIGSSKDISIKELAEMVKAIVGFEGTISWDDSKPDGTPRKLMDTTKILEKGWRPEISLKEGIRSVFNDYKKQ
ncbi:MAG: GDP-L-fucose synthase [Roseivirga sp.]|jgi:GDP-L-fucose synthase|uniref:GDP-L-fucose synthase family protein n=1 Tax=Roseivirga sp. TaxID=1964215 RepID=UPI001B0EA162|nr:GDP-L-fucose synthase [Roseivirga sp.]MBO6497565.1 GDP-L-fucose synthase [Roseivirga sp.]